MSQEVWLLAGQLAGRHVCADGNPLPSFSSRNSQFTGVFGSSDVAFENVGGVRGKYLKSHLS